MKKKNIGIVVKDQRRTKRSQKKGSGRTAARTFWKEGRKGL